MIRVVNLDREFSELPGQNLLNSLLSGGAPVHTVCGGKGKCGCCRVRLEQGAAVTPVTEMEHSRLGEELLSQGWRLSCQLRFMGDLAIYLPPADALPAACRRG